MGARDAQTSSVSITMVGESLTRGMPNACIAKSSS